MKTLPPAGGKVRTHASDRGSLCKKGHPAVKRCVGYFKVLVKQPDNYSLRRNYQASRFITLPHGLLGLIGMGDTGTTTDCESSEFSLNLPK